MGRPRSDPYLDLADDASLRAAVSARIDERSRHERATELATWTGTLRDLAERAVPVVVRTGHGRTHRGVLVAIGIDHLAIRLMSTALVLVAIDTVRLVRPDPGANGRAATGDRDRSQDRTLAEELALLAEQVHIVVVGLRGIEDPVRGVVLGLGEDVLTLRGDGADGGTSYLPLGAIAELLIERSDG